MTAQVFTARVKPRGAFALDKRYGHIKLDAAAVSDLQALTTAATVEDVLRYLNELVGDYLTTAASRTGKATSVRN